MTEAEKLAICTILKIGFIPETQLKYSFKEFIELPEITPSDKADMINLTYELEALFTKEKEKFDDLKDTSDIVSEQYWELKKTVEDFIFKIQDPKITSMYEYKNLLKAIDS